MKSSSKAKIGELFVQEGLLTSEQLAQALAAQKAQHPYMPLGEVCAELKFFSRAVLRAFLRKHQKNILLGELLTNLGLVTEKQLQEALEHQRSSQDKLGIILVLKGYLTEAALISVLSIQLGIPKIIPNPSLIDRNLLKGVSQSFLQKHMVLPCSRDRDVLTLIMADPLSENSIRDLEGVFRCKIQPAIASTHDIHEAIIQCFQKKVTGKQTTSGDPHKNLIISETKAAEAGDGNIVEVINFIILNAVIDGASDIHIEPQDTCVRVRYRIDGVLYHKTDLPLHKAPELISRIKVLCGLDIAERRRHQDGRIEARVMNREVDLRVSTYAGVYGESIVIRILFRQTNLIELDALGFSPFNLSRYQKFMECPSGIILVTGPTGSGKTTTLYASLNSLNNTGSKIITVEDPVEYTIPGVVHAKLDPKLGLSYSDFLKSMMRQDPDILMVGEIRDKQSAEAVIQAALTGHKVFSTFHTEDTIGALLRLMDMGIETFLITSTLVSVVAQRLIRVLCPHCRQPSVPTKNILDAFHIRAHGLDAFTFYQAQGCDLCRGTGFKGRTAIHEVLAVNDVVRECVVSRMSAGKIRLLAREKAQLISLREDCFYKATQGITTLEEAVRVAFHNPSDELLTRSAEEVVALCEGRAPMIPSEPHAPEKTDTDVPHIRTSETPSTPAGEVYRIRFESGTIETEVDQITNLFRAYQAAMVRMDRPLDWSLLEDFISFIIQNVKRLKTSEGAEFVEISVVIKENKATLVVESLLLRADHDTTLRQSRETGLRQINYLR